MGKRANNSAAKTGNKKPKVEAGLALVMDTVKKAPHLPDTCGAMLASMLPFSLALATEDRAECQQRVVSMVEETLSTMKTELQSAIGHEEVNVNGLNNNMAEVVSKVQAAESTVASKKEAVQAAHTAYTDADAAEKTSSEEFASKKKVYDEAAGNLSSVQKEKGALEEAFEAHFKTPMAAGQGPHFKQLEPFLKTMDIEKSMLHTLPGTCAKAALDRGSFDQVILEQFEKAIAAKISSLAESVTSHTASVAELESAMKAAEADHTAKKEVQQQTKDAHEAAQKEQAAADAALAEASDAVSSFQPQLSEANSLLDAAKSKLEGFENGPLAKFGIYKTKTAIVEEAAAAEVAPAAGA